MAARKLAKLPNDWAPGAGLLYKHLNGGTFYTETRIGDSVDFVWNKADGTVKRGTATVAEFAAKVAQP